MSTPQKAKYISRGKVMIMNKRSLIVVLAMLELSACQTQTNYPTVAPAQSFEGQWFDQNGILSTFNNGKFQTKTTDGTNTLLAIGDYKQVSPTLAEIELKSLVRRTVTKVNCALATQNRMNCTTSSGSQFALLRQA
jgi:hypothetical protein